MANTSTCKFCKCKKVDRLRILLHYLKIHFYCEPCDAQFTSHSDVLKHQNDVHNKQFQCQVCLKNFLCKYSLRLHVNTSHVDDSEVNKKEKKKYYCDLCDFVTIHQSNLRDHNLAIHMKKNDFKCDKCEYTTSVQANLRKHDKSKHQNSDNLSTFECELCDYTFKGSSKQNLINHMKIHETNRPRVKCEHCGKEFLSQSSLKSHIKLKHREVRYKCDICHEQSRTVTFHKIHMRSHMSAEEQLKCTKCETYVTNNPYKLKNHMRLNHSSTRSVKKNCIVCKIEFNSFSDYNKHMREVHPKGTKVVCEFCSSDFSDIWTWKMHLLRSHFICHKCDNKFENDNDMLNHMKDSHGDDYQCNQCPQRFFERKHLARHIKKVHENFRYEKRFPCDACDYIATVPSQLKNHKEVKHERKVMYKCELCDHQTSYKSHFQKRSYFHNEK